ncbi:methyltransferase [Aureibacter tunicatorum]|uniref:Nicotinamide N-methyase n=1 Tax=Aureibacter tunicatorum TaxID=866807 RepID=A0AAE3XR58_9BACT|nr:methyltransferase [Aureibacter tunicatorum]MDR6241160.1 putative nicotinamide N-methyase [Aureibacter tunicatorum]BDD03935.1 methyltransferase [Aureibacter tunicatorum]
MKNTIEQLTPQQIMQVGTGFWPSKILLTAVNFEIFTLLAEKEQLSAKPLKNKLELKCTDRHFFDFLDVLVGLGFLQREGLLESASYRNSPETDLFLDKSKPTYIGGILEMMNNRLFSFWGNLDEALKTGEAQNEAKYGKQPIFELLYQNEQMLKGFVNAMTGMQIGNFMTLAEKFDFTSYNSLLDVGGSAGVLSLLVAKHNSHMNCLTLDLPPLEKIANETINKFGLEDQVKAVSGDFFEIEFPKSDVVVMGNILHDWNEEKKLLLIEKAYQALPENGCLIVIETIIDNERKTNPFGMMMSLNMLIENQDGFDFTLDDFTNWTTKVGFRETKQMHLTGPTSAVIAFK